MIAIFWKNLFFWKKVQRNSNGTMCEFSLFWKIKHEFPILCTLKIFNFVQFLIFFEFEHLNFFMFYFCFPFFNYFLFFYFSIFQFFNFWRLDFVFMGCFHIFIASFPHGHMITNYHIYHALCYFRNEFGQKTQRYLGYGYRSVPLGIWSDISFLWWVYEVVREDMEIKCAWKLKSKLKKSFFLFFFSNILLNQLYHFTNKTLVFCLVWW